MKKEEHHFKEGDKVFAKIKGYPPWPAIVLEETGKKYKVKFYGTGEIGHIKFEDLFYYTRNKQKLLKPIKRKEFNDSVKEIEEAIRKAGTDGSPDNENEKEDNVDSNDSLTTDLDSSVKIGKRKRSLSVSAKAKKRKASISGEESSNASPVNEDSFKLKEENIIKNKQERKENIKDEDKPKEIERNVNDKAVTTPEKKSPLKPSVTVNKVDKPVESIQPKDFVLEKDLEAFIAYGEFVEKHEDIYSKMPVEERYDSELQILPFFSGKKAIGIKLHQTWPLKSFKNELERALYDKEIAQSALNMKTSFKQEQMQKNLNIYCENLEINEESLDKLYEDKLMTFKTDLMTNLKTEASLVEHDASIKTCLNLDKAEPKKAIVLLEEMLDLQVSEIMLLKHARVVDVVRRLRKYVGNIESWNLTEEEKNIFKKDAEEVRNTALKVYVKFMQIISKPSEGEGFWDAFNDMSSKFRQETKDLSEAEFYLLTSKPYSRKNFMNNYILKEIPVDIPVQKNKEIDDEKTDKNEVDKNDK